MSENATQEKQKHENLNEAVSVSQAERAGKYLTFVLGDEEYGLEILKVREIIGLMPITKMPKAPDFIRGVINLRGKVIPVVSTRKKFGMPIVDDTEQSCIIVVEVVKKNESIEMGILVDAVSEVLDISADEIEDTPEFGGDVHNQFILGVAKAKGSVKILLAIDKVLAKEELENLKTV